MLTRDNITILQLQQHLPFINFRVPTLFSTVTVRLTCSGEELQQKYKVRLGQVIHVDRARFIVLGADVGVWLHHQAKNNIVKMSTLNGKLEISNDIAPMTEIMNALFAKSNIATYIENFNINRYRLTPVGNFVRVPDESIIGKGCDSTVYKVVTGNETIACKVLKEKTTCYSSELRMLLFLADNTPDNYLMRLKHFAIDLTAREQLVFDHMDMGDLNQYWQPENKDYSLDSCYRILHSVICGIQQLHHLNIIHRDIKPANIYLTKDRSGGIQARLGDFGFAQFLNEMKGQKILGTPNYFAPELWEAFEVPSHAVPPEVNSTFATDIYAFGISVYETVVRHMVYPEVDSIGELQETVCDSENSPSHNITSDHPPASIKLISIFTQCTNYDRAARPTANSVKQLFNNGP